MNIKYRSGFMPKLRPNTQFFKQVGQRCLSLFLALVVALIATFSFNTQNAFAADRINFIYRGAREAITLQDLQNFVRQGMLPSAFNRLQLNSDEIKILRDALGQEIPLPKKFVEQLVRSSIGQFILSRIDPVIGDGTVSSVSNLADALVKTARNDKINLLEVFEFYPASEISVRGELVSDAVNRVRLIADTVLPMAEVVRGYMYDIVCTDNLFGYQPDTQIPDILAGSSADKFSWLK